MLRPATLCQVLASAPTVSWVVRPATLHQVLASAPAASWVAATVEHRASGITVLQAADMVGQARVGVAVDLGLGVGDHIQQRLGNGQVIALV